MARLQFPFIGIFISSLIFFTIASCGDDTISSSDNVDVPSVPAFIHAFMADEIFTENNPDLHVREVSSKESFLEHTHQFSETGRLNPGVISRYSEVMTENSDTLSHFYTAEALIGEVRSTLQYVQYLYYQLFIPVLQLSPTINDGSFLWEYNMQVTNRDMGLDIQVTAIPAEADDEYHWIMTIKGLYADDASVEVTVLEAVCSFNGLAGSVHTNMPVLMGGEIFKSDIIWVVENNMFHQMEFDFEFNDEEADQIRTLATYSLDNEQSLASLTDAWVFVENELDSHFEMQWNIETDSGNVTLNGEQLCWDEDLQDTLCE